MKKFLLVSLLLVATMGLASCSDSQAPLTEAEQAEKYGMSVSDFKEQKEAAARMNMTIEDHLKMSDNSGNGDKMDMDMGDDSSMIEDDSSDSQKMPKGAHKMPDGTMMDADGNTIKTNDETTKEGEMHVKMMHDGDKNVAPHPPSEH